MLLSLLAFGFLIPNPQYPQAQPFLEAMYREFDPSLVPHFYQIALCESSLRQWKDDGSVLVSSTTDYGILQINKVHEEEAKNLGIDFKDSIEANVKMAKVVYEKQGFEAWTCARKLGIKTSA